MARNIGTIKLHLKASNEAKIEALMLLNNQVNDTEFEYDVSKVGKVWYSWFRVNLSGFKRRVFEKDLPK